MTLTINLTSEEAGRVEDARRRGLDVEEMVHQVIAHLPQHSESPAIGREIVAAWEQAGVINSRPDISDSQSHARKLRQEAQLRTRAS